MCPVYILGSILFLSFVSTYVSGLLRSGLTDSHSLSLFNTVKDVVFSCRSEHLSFSSWVDLCNGVVELLDKKSNNLSKQEEIDDENNISVAESIF